MKSLQDLISERSLAEASRLPTGSRPETEAGEELATDSENPASPVLLTSEPKPVSEPDAKAESQVPRGVAEVVTPSGIQIYYQAAPKRLYKVNGKEVPSVTTALDILEKGGLPWWGMGIGVEGLLTLFLSGILTFDPASSRPVIVARNTLATKDDIIELLTEHKLTVNHVRDDAGTRGTNVHDALEYWAETGKLAKLETFATDEQGYVAGLNLFLQDSGAEAQSFEVMVGSAKHKYAGRYDLDAILPKSLNIINKLYPKAKPIRGVTPAGLWRLDLKTSKEVYDTHFMQLEAYETAAVEDGYSASDYRGVVRVSKDGGYELVPNAKWYTKAKVYNYDEPKATFTDFKAVLSLSKRLEAMNTR